jgi:hypothetical protein
MRQIFAKRISMNNKLTTVPEDKINIQKALVGAVYGLVMGSAFVFVSAYIDRWLYPTLPLGMDWDQVSARWMLIGLGLALTGAITCLFYETFYGLLAGAVTAGLLALSTALFLSSTGTGAKFVVLVFTLAPIAVMSLPIILVLRRLAEKHVQAQYLKWSVLRIAALMVITVGLGAGGGYFMKISDDAVKAVRLVQENIHAAPESRNKEMDKLPGIQQHIGAEYVIFQSDSTTSTTGFDVRLVFEDGYEVECIVVVYPGATPYIRSCREIGQ